MASTTPNVILVEVNSESGSRPINEGSKAAEIITPGQFIEMDTSETLVKHPTASGNAQPIRIAVESPYGDDFTVSALANTYIVGEGVRFIHPQAGDIVYAFIKASETLVKGRSRLVSDGAGALQVVSTVDATVIAGAIIAVSEVDAVIGGSATRQLVRIV